jgi:hypothetical protein
MSLREDGMRAVLSSHKQSKEAADEELTEKQARDIWDKTVYTHGIATGMFSFEIDGTTAVTLHRAMPKDVRLMQKQRSDYKKVRISAQV